MEAAEKKQEQAVQATVYRTNGKLTNPVNDLDAARQYLKPEGGMTQFLGYWAEDADLAEKVALIEWDLIDEESWQVTVFAKDELTDEQRRRLSSWISGQNSDGLGEGFEQQKFAESFETNVYGDIDEDTYEMSSFDWATNQCELTKVV